MVATRKDEQNQAAVDPWTLVHFSTGLALGLVEAPLDKVLGGALGYEVAEQFAERQEWGQDFFESSGPEHLVNAAVDVGAFLLGHWLGRRWNRT
ncbi:MAG: hypothetical protein R3223_12785 [Longimicrobiales bacterium]|nr:hypothetical protein [Longimicrobiales bacterium]